jgi:hypothetical protein
MKTNAGFFAIMLAFSALAVPADSPAAEKTKKITLSSKAKSTQARKPASEPIACDPASGYDCELEKTLEEEFNSGLEESTENANRCYDQAVQSKQSGQSTPPTPAPATPWHNCPEVTVRCVPINQMPGGGGGACVGCTMYLTPATCKVRGLTDGQKLKPEDIKKFREKWRELDRKGRGVYSILAYCLALHENEHQFDYQSPRVRSCQTEQNAYNIHKQCLDFFINALCSQGADPRWNESECNRARRNLRKIERTLAYNQCYCSVPCPAGQGQCDTCRQACEASCPADEQPDCDSANRLYCNELHRGVCPVRARAQ